MAGLARVLTLCALLAVSPARAGFAVAMVAGAGKEYLHDLNSDPRDMLANAIGGTLGGCVFRF